jgi:predicted ArsR family transcriptional regulator
MAQDDFASRVAGVAALAEPARRDLYRYVVDQADAVSRDQAAEGIGVPRHTAKFHLDKLVEEGLLVAEFRRLSGRRGPGAGRPAKLYRRAPGELAVSLPERRYDLAGHLMAQAIEDSTRNGTPGDEALGVAAATLGAELGREARQRAGESADPDRQCHAACQVLAGQGYEPHQDDGTISLRNCPFHSLAQEHTDLVCGMNLAMLHAFAGQLGEGRMTASLRPDPDRCCVQLSASGAEQAPAE